MVEKIKGLTYVPREKKYFEDRLNMGFMETEQITVPNHFGRRRRYKTMVPYLMRALVRNVRLCIVH
jgi:hypothetical protein